MSSATKSSPLKRPHPVDDAPRPFKMQVVEVTGLEQDPLTKNITARSICTISASEISAYKRRRKVTRYADLIRRKKAMASKIKGDWSGMPNSSQQGMTNITGALCYRLSLLQVLLHQPKFVHLLQDFHRLDQCVSDDKEKCICCVLREFCLEYWRGSSRDPSGSGLTKTIRQMNVLFKSAGWSPDVAYGHADPDEQISWLFSMMQAELPKSIFSCLEAIMLPVFTTAICCNRCGFESRTNGHEDRALPVPIQPALRNGTLGMYLQKYMVEMIDGYRCDSCKDSTSKKYRKQLLSYAPDTLVIQLKRTSIHGVKLNTPVTINPILDLSHYQDEASQNQLRYELTAVIKHRGTLSAGHYTCATKGPDNTWYGFDDERKSVSSLAGAASVTSPFTPYLLFFQRKEG